MTSTQPPSSGGPLRPKDTDAQLMTNTKARPFYKTRKIIIAIAIAMMICIAAACSSGSSDGDTAGRDAPPAVQVAPEAPDAATDAIDETVEVVMPDVEGKTLDVALSDIKRAGIDDEPEVLGGGTFGVVVESNWEVVEQLPAAGEAVTGIPRLTVDRPSDYYADADADADADDDYEYEYEYEYEYDDFEDDETLTVKNNEDLAALLAVKDSHAPMIEAFAADYEGRTIEFDGNIAAMDHHGDHKTRFDMLIAAGDYDPNTWLGPGFRFEDVSFGDLNLTGRNIPDAIGTGDNLHIVAEVGDYDANTGAFYLTPVSTRVR